jgi:hypothetical protein
MQWERRLHKRPVIDFVDGRVDWLNSSLVLSLRVYDPGQSLVVMKT